MVKYDTIRSEIILKDIDFTWLSIGKDDEFNDESEKSTFSQSVFCYYMI